MAPKTTFSDPARRDLAAATVHHPLFAQAKAQCLEALASPSDLSFVLLAGAAGSGKSHLLRLVYAELLASHAAAMARDPDVIPVLLLNAPTPKDGTFRWRTLGADLFEAARLPGGLRPSAPRFVSGGPTALRARTYGLTVDETLREATRACVDRGVRVILLDEAGHLTSVAYSRRPRQQLDVLKGLALEAGVRFVLAGPYDLLDFRDASAQISRRSRLVHVAPYRRSLKRERDAFAEIVASMLEIEGLTLREGVDWPAVFHDGTEGCVGLLRDWIVEAASAWRLRGGASPIEECIEELRLSRGQIASIRGELLTGLARVEADRRGAREPSEAKPAHKAPVTLNGQTLKPGEARPSRRHGGVAA